MARTVKQIPPLTGIQIEEDSGYNNHPLLKTCLKEVETVRDSRWESFKIEPEVKGRVWDCLDLEAHFTEARDDVVAFFLEWKLERRAMRAGSGLTLKWVCRAFISVRTLAGSSIETAASWKGTLAPPSRYEPQDPIALMNSYSGISTTESSGLKETHLWSYNPCNSPSRKSESLCESVNDQDIVFINVVDVLRCTNCGAVAIASIVVSAIKFVHDQCSPVSTDILDLSKLRVLDHSSSRVSRVRCQNYRRTTCNLFCNLVRVDMVSILLGQRTRNRSELLNVSPEF
jgi:hypothetical protein